MNCNKKYPKFCVILRKFTEFSNEKRLKRDFPPSKISYRSYFCTHMRNIFSGFIEHISFKFWEFSRIGTIHQNLANVPKFSQKPIIEITEISLNFEFWISQNFPTWIGNFPNILSNSQHFTKSFKNLLNFSKFCRIFVRRMTRSWIICHPPALRTCM